MNLICKYIKFIFLLLFVSTLSKAKPKEVFVIEIKSEIDPRMSRYVNLAFKEAQTKNAELIIIDLNTYGGALTDADSITQVILGSKVPVYVFINKNAASAGALISIACDKIYMIKGSSIGAATVVNGNNGEAAPDKYQSYMRSIMRSTAEAKGRNPRLAEAMVDQDIKIDSSIKKDGKVLTFTLEEAIKYGFCEAEAKNIEEILAINKIKEYKLSRFSLSWTEVLISKFLNPYVSSILILIMLGGIYYELQSPGIGFPLIAAILAAICYFMPYYLNGLAANWEIILFLVGIILIGLELFVIPGFGITGITGIAFFCIALVLMMLNNIGLDFDLVNSGSIKAALLAVSFGVICSLGLVIFTGGRIADGRMFKKMALHQVIKQENEAGTANPKTISRNSLLGQFAIAFTDLKPGGKIFFEDQVIEAVSIGEYINKDEKILILDFEMGTAKVKKA